MWNINTVIVLMIYFLEKLILYGNKNPLPNTATRDYSYIFNIYSRE
ncbi:hypothetical protein XBO1_1970007 [Xenorhabdus bovienii str. oregonense]|uniref:Uncharacterized protein n=1 Tax=Xenorhabdus bovienii str. oregonense TaxID=1398202 RepID=A0A077P791_XENBV|nr:hypothetical protein XBO1_1970007 [Xenorhabdus bovienii str. oregonense]